MTYGQLLASMTEAELVLWQVRAQMLEADRLAKEAQAG